MCSAHFDKIKGGGGKLTYEQLQRRIRNFISSMMCLKTDKWLSDTKTVFYHSKSNTFHT